MIWFGALAQLGERLLCKHQVIGSIPIGSTISLIRSAASAASAVWPCEPLVRLSAGQGRLTKISRDEDTNFAGPPAIRAAMRIFDIVNGFF